MKFFNLLIAFVFCHSLFAQEVTLSLDNKSMKIRPGQTLNAFNVATGLGKNASSSVQVPEGLAVELCVNSAPKKAPCAIYLKDVGALPQMFRGGTSYARAFKLNPDYFSLMVASDTQFFWAYEDESKRAGRSAEEQSLTGNKEMVDTVNKLASKEPNTLLGMVINGDLTAYGHENEFEAFKKFYDPNPTNNTNSVNLPVFPGLGNHDYANNVKRDLTDLKGEGCMNNNCALRMINFIKDFATNNPNIESFDPNSYSYSWSYGDYTFVQLNNYPSYEVEFGYITLTLSRIAVKITSSVPWLKTILENAKNAGKKVVLNFHDFHSQKNKNDYDFNNSVANSSVVAIFAGHLHSISGKLDEPFRPSPDKEIPVFLSGSAMTNLINRASFYKDKIEVETFSTVNGEPQSIKKAVVYHSN